MAFGQNESLKTMVRTGGCAQKGTKRVLLFVADRGRPMGDLTYIC